MMVSETETRSIISIDKNNKLLSLTALYMHVYNRLDYSGFTWVNDMLHIWLKP